MYSAATPAACGADMDVPVMTADAVSEARPALKMSTPGACSVVQLPLHMHMQCLTHVCIHAPQQTLDDSRNAYKRGRWLKMWMPGKCSAD